MGVDRSAIVESESLEQEIEGLDALDVPFVEPERKLRRFWRSAWPKLAAVGVRAGRLAGGSSGSAGVRATCCPGPPASSPRSAS